MEAQQQQDPKQQLLQSLEELFPNKGAIWIARAAMAITQLHDDVAAGLVSVDADTKRAAIEGTIKGWQTQDAWQHLVVLFDWWCRFTAQKTVVYWLQPPGRVLSCTEVAQRCLALVLAAVFAAAAAWACWQLFPPRAGRFAASCLVGYVCWGELRRAMLKPQISNVSGGPPGVVSRVAAAVAAAVTSQQQRQQQPAIKQALLWVYRAVVCVWFAAHMAVSATAGQVVYLWIRADWYTALEYAMKLLGCVVTLVSAATACVVLQWGATTDDRWKAVLLVSLAGFMWCFHAVLDLIRDVSIHNNITLFSTGCLHASCILVSCMLFLFEAMVLSFVTDSLFLNELVVYVRYSRPSWQIARAAVG